MSDNRLQAIKLRKGGRSEIYSAIRKYLLGLFPDIDVVQAYQSNAPMPTEDYISMWILYEKRTSFNQKEYFPSQNMAASETNTNVYVQLDFYGKDADWRQRSFCGLFTDIFCFDNTPAPLSPIEIFDVKYTPVQDEHLNWIPRWSVTAVYNFNSVTSHPQLFVDILEIETIDSITITEVTNGNI